MKRFLYFFCVSLVVAAGLSVVFYYGAQIEPVPIVEMKSFQSVEDFSHSLFQSLQEDFKTSSVVVMGVMPEQSEGFEIVEKILQLMNQNGIGPEVIVVEPDFGPEGFFPDATSLSLMRETSRLAAGLKNAKSQNLRTLIIAPAPAVIPWALGSPAGQLREQEEIEFISLAISSFPRERAAEKSFPLNCKTETHDRKGMGSLGCYVISKARTQYRESRDVFRFYGSLDRVGEGRDYIGLLNAPERPEVTK